MTVKHFVNTLLIILLLCFAEGGVITPKSKMKDEWQARENIVYRLNSEWYKINLIKSELSRVENIMAEINSLKQYPVNLTNFTDSTVYRIETATNKTVKVKAVLLNRMTKLKSSLLDAIAIARELVAGEPIDDMFEIIEKANVERTTELLQIKQSIDSLWQGIDTLLAYLQYQAKIEYSPLKKHLTEDLEFRETAESTPQMQSRKYYIRLSEILDSLVGRAQPSQLNQFFSLEISNLKRYVEKKDLNIAQLLATAMEKRYSNRLNNISELYLLLTNIYFLNGMYDLCIKSAENLPDIPQYASINILYKLQSWYAQKNYSAIWNFSSSIDIKKLSGEKRNLALWIILESALELNEHKRILSIAADMVKNASYSYHVLHSLMKFYVIEEDFSTAISVAETALRGKPQTDIDKYAYDNISLYLAQLYYETNNYEKASALFVKLLNHPRFFEKALIGIIWCKIKSKDYESADISLRKLINQSPQSPLAAEAILLLAKRYLNKARYDWDKILYIENNQKRLVEMLQKFENKAKNDSESVKIAEARKQLQRMLDQLQQEQKPQYHEIVSAYDKATKICELIEKFYKTGSFQETSFSLKRENILRTLDSLQLAIEKEDAVATEKQVIISNALAQIDFVKKVVQNAKVLRLQCLLDRYRWEREYLDLQKTTFTNRIKEINSKMHLTADSLQKSLAKNEINLLTKKIDSLVARGDVLRQQEFDRLSRECLDLLTLPLSPADEVYVRYNLGELYYEDENEKFGKEYSRYESDLARYDSLMAKYEDGILSEPPQQPNKPRLDHSASLEQFKLIVEKYPEDDLIPAVRYSLAWCYNDIGMFENAIKEMYAVADSTPNNEYSAQAWMYIGEYMFDNGRLEKALEAYQAVLRYPESEWFDEALYKLAWTQYRLSNPKKAISSFLALVDLEEKSGSGKILLQKESMDYIAISFSETDPTGEKGLELATKFLKRYGDTIRSPQILQRLAEVYNEQGRFKLSQKTYHTLLQMYPKYAQGHVVELGLISAMERSNINTEEVNKMKIDFFRKYNYKSEWASSQNEQIRRQADSIAASMLYDAATSYHQLALQRSDTSSYRQAARIYEKYLSNYPATPVANECHYNLAEIMFSLGDYYKAAEEYISVSKRYPDSKYRETAAWNAIVASQNLLKLQQGEAKQ